MCYQIVLENKERKLLISNFTIGFVLTMEWEDSALLGQAMYL